MRDNGDGRFIFILCDNTHTHTLTDRIEHTVKRKFTNKNKTKITVPISLVGFSANEMKKKKKKDQRNCFSNGLLRFTVGDFVLQRRPQISLGT